MRAVFVIAMLGLVAAAPPASAYCFGSGKTYVCIDNDGNVDTWVQSPGGTLHIETPADRSDRYPNAGATKSAPKPSSSEVGGSTGSAVLQPSGAAGAATLATPSASGGGTVLQGTGGGASVSTCGSTGTCQQ